MKLRVIRSVQRYVGLFAIVFCLAFAFSAREESSVFQKCISQQATQYATHQQVESTSYIPILLIERWPISMACTGDYLNTNNGAINAVATIVIATFTIILVSVSRQQYALTRETLVADKRAYVFAIGFQQQYEKIGELYHWRFKPNWKNTGDTPTRNLRLYSHCDVRNSQLPDAYSFDAGNSVPGGGLLAPTQEASGGAAPHFPTAPISPPGPFSSDYWVPRASS